MVLPGPPSGGAGPRERPLPREERGTQARADDVREVCGNL